jgi:hypothetical protein
MLEEPGYFLSAVPQTLAALFGIIFAIGAIIVGGPIIRTRGPLFPFVLRYPSLLGAFACLAMTIGFSFFRLCGLGWPYDTQLLTLAVVTLLVGILAGHDLIGFSHPEYLVARLARSVRLRQVLGRHPGTFLGGLPEDPDDLLVVARRIVLSHLTASQSPSAVDSASGYTQVAPEDDVHELRRRSAVHMVSGLLAQVSWPLDPLTVENWRYYVRSHLEKLSADDYWARYGVSWAIHDAICRLPADSAHPRLEPRQEILGFYADLIVTMLGPEGTPWQTLTPLMRPLYALLARAGIEDWVKSHFVCKRGGLGHATVASLF